ncbi:prepilin-type N-terminal cleavage/methylation domain-containing protein [Arsukibacterium sp.]|uniref:prepilin-type N-terminal cleavage/methylation domain-containing protein n=1 Tax=Arsukibacterium sp. TaxID=1977258 RepID=UPI002FD9DE08
MGRGFTLIELLVVLVLLAVLAVGVSSYIGTGARMYTEATGRQQLLEQGRFAAERMVRELRNAAPNSVRSNNTALWHCLEFSPVLGSGLYQNAPIKPISDTALHLLAIGWSSDWIGLPFTLYPTTPSDIYTALATGSAIDSASLLLNAVVLDDSQFGRVVLDLDTPHSFAADSPERRFYLLAPSPVSYCLDGAQQRLYRYSGYAYSAAQQLPPGSTGVLMAKGVAEARFAVVPPVLTRNAVVNLQLRLENNAVSPAFFNYEVHLVNVP